MIVDDYLKKLNEQDDGENFEIRSSPIHGQGCFAKRNFRKGDFIYHHFLPGEKITRFGAHLNHSSEPTAFSKKSEDGYDPVYALKDILKGDEITLNYSSRPDLEQAEADWD